MTASARRANRPVVSFVVLYAATVFPMFVLTLVLTIGAQRGWAAPSPVTEPGDHHRASKVEIALVAEEGCAPRLREVLAEQLAGVAGEVVWSCHARFDEQDLFRRPPPGQTAVRMWIDVSPAAEARIFLEDERLERFVVRRISLPHGIDEVSREEIGEIVRFATLAVLAGRDETLTRAEVRATLSTWPAPQPKVETSTRAERPRDAETLARAQPPRNAETLARAQPPRNAETPARAALPRKTETTRVESSRAAVTRAQAEPSRAAVKAAGVESPERPGSWKPALEIGPAWSLLAFSREIPIVQELALSVALVGSSWPVSAWTEAGVRLPTMYHADPVGVDLGATSLRMGMTFSRRAGRLASWGVGAGGGLNRISFSPTGAAASVDEAPAGHFLTLAARLLFAFDWRVSTHLALGVRLTCDIATADIHYDLHGADGLNRRVVTPFGLMPGLTLVAGWRP